MIYDLTLAGYDGSTDKTDHLVKWIDAPNIKAVRAFANKLGLLEWTIDEMDNQDVGFADGLDVRLDVDGDILEASEFALVNTWVDQQLVGYLEHYAAARKHELWPAFVAWFGSAPEYDEWIDGKDGNGAGESWNAFLAGYDHAKKVKA